ncbi:Os04g0357601 [Oryza sativa Japonica Group]|uniref:Os04g0357601 protein n=2 Tax=Oryza sativa TaxID=4530 RepID=A0A0P0W985_ORYSJ|nr:hypothetical protein OsI_15492 [Oryza sativa Indica Group]BAS88754.1 Os04g0357601 [Oryza sativa Japonica Group]
MGVRVRISLPSPVASRRPSVERPGPSGDRPRPHAEVAQKHIDQDTLQSKVRLLSKLKNGLHVNDPPVWAVFSRVDADAAAAAEDAPRYGATSGGTRSSDA